MRSYPRHADVLHRTGLPQPLVTLGWPKGIPDEPASSRNSGTETKAVVRVPQKPF